MDLLLILTILLSLFTGVIGRFVPFNYFDEIVFAVIFVVGIFYIFFEGKRLPHSFKKGLMWFFFYLLMCLISTIVYQYQTNGMAILKDIVAICKMPFIICFGMLIFKNGGLSLKGKKTLFNILKFTTIIMFACALLNLVVDIKMSTEVRHGLRTFRFLFNHETTMVSTVAIMTGLLAIEKFTSKYVWMNIFILFASGRDKAYVLIIIYFVALLILKLKTIKNKKAFVFFLSIPIAFLIFLFTYDKIMNSYIYYGTDTARMAFIIHGFEFANQSFPLGTGFATWANTPSGEYYSVLYHIKEMETIYGIEFAGNADGANYWNDTFWPSIYTQGGYLGLFGYLSMLFIYLREFFRYSKNKPQLRRGLIIIVNYMLIASLLESYFTNDASVSIALVLVLFFKNEPVKVVKPQAVPLTVAQEGECS